MRVVFLAALLVAPIAATAQQSGAPAGTNAQTPPPSDPNDLRVRCRTEDTTGNMARRQRLCMTIAEWREYRRNGNRIARGVVDNANACGGGAACRADPPP